MPKSGGAVSNQPFKGELVDLEQAGGTMGIEALGASVNVHHTDTGTITRRPGLRSIHQALNLSGSILELEAPDDYAIGGMYDFRVSHNQGYVSKMYVAKVNDYLVGSQFGVKWDIPLASGLGGSLEQAYFTEVYLDSALRRYLIVGSSQKDFGIHYWDGVVCSHGAAGAGDRAKWDYLTRLEWIPEQFKFTAEHNQRLFAGGSGSVVVYSQSGNFLAHQGQIVLEPRFGDVTGFMPTYYGELIVGQERAISKVKFDPDNGLPLAAETITTEYGLVGHNAVGHLGNDLIFMNTRGQITTVGTTDRFGSLETGLMSKKVFRRFDKIQRQAWPHVWIQDDPEDSILWIGHSRHSGAKNDTMTGWNYKNDKFEVVSNRSIVGPSCAAVLALPRFNGNPRIFIGSYLVGTSPARMFHFDEQHKEDCLSATRTESDGSADEILGDTGKIFWPGHAPLGSASISAANKAKVLLTGTYTGTPTTTTLILRMTASGTIGSGTVTAELWDKGKPERGVLAQALGSAYTPEVAFNLDNGTDTGLNLSLPAMAVVKGEELFIHVYNRRKVADALLSNISDLNEGMGITGKGSLAASNFVPYIETLPMVYGSPHQDVRVDGVTIVTRVTGNRADTVTHDVDDFTTTSGAYPAGQNQYRHMIDLYVRIDKDATWQHLAIVDSNSSQRPHLDPSQAEIATAVVDRVNAAGGVSLQHVTATSDTEATGTPMAKNSDINTEYIGVNRTGRVFQFRFGQETAASGGGTSTFGFRNGNFEIVGFHVHVTPGRDTAQNMGDGSLTVRI